jgi:hypothetical protein
MGGELLDAEPALADGGEPLLRCGGAANDYARQLSNPLIAVILPVTVAVPLVLLTVTALPGGGTAGAISA